MWTVDDKRRCQNSSNSQNLTTKDQITRRRFNGVLANDLEYLRMTLAQRWRLCLGWRWHTLRTRVSWRSLTAFIIMLRSWRVRRMSALVTSGATGNGTCGRLRRRHRLQASIVLSDKCCQSKLVPKWDSNLLQNNKVDDNNNNRRKIRLTSAAAAGPLRTASPEIQCHAASG